MANWELFQNNLNSGINSFLARKEEERRRQQEYNEAMRMMIMKAQMEQEAKLQDPFYQMRLKLMQGLGQRPPAATPIGMSGMNIPQENAPAQPQGIPNMQDYQIDPNWIFGGGDKPFMMNPQKAMEQETQKQKLIEQTRTNIGLNKDIRNAQMDLVKYRRTINPILQDVDRVLGYWKDIPAHQKGPIDRWLPGRGLGAASLRAGGQKIKNLSPEAFARLSPEEIAIGRSAAPVTTYQDIKTSILSNIARQFGGEKGVLTDTDIKRIDNMWPQQQDDDATAYRKIAGIKVFLISRVRNYSSNTVRQMQSWQKQGGTSLIRDNQARDFQQQDDIPQQSNNRLDAIKSKWGLK